jgi:Protein of unknown function (DUF2851)
MLLADRYAELRAAPRVRERSLFPARRTPSELEIQARWFSGEFGTEFVSTSGDKIEIVQFGTWNREAGPDFRDVAIRLNGGEPLRGCVEIDLTDRSWEAHGHAINPAFEETVLHVFVEQSERTFFTRTKSNRNVPQVRIDLANLAEAFSLNIPLARSGRCQAPLKDLPAERVSSVLDGATRFRLRKKATRLRQNTENHGKDEALFQELAVALGYKENKLPFMLLAQRLPVKALRENGPGAEAMLFGFAGFLQAPDLGVYESSTREYVRKLWDRWWPRRDEMQRLVLPAKVWRMTGTRPANHPQRRLAALAAIVSQWPALRRAFDKRTIESAQLFFGALDHSFWKFHYTLAADPAAKAMALVGESRVSEILANVFFPFWLSENADVWTEYAKLPARLSNRRVETAATRLFGSDPRRAQFTKTVAQQQGLLQIYEDFCLQDNSDCAQCPFPEQMAKWT